MQYHRIYSDKLDSQKNWYAYNRSIAGFQKSNTQHTCGGNVLFKSLQADIQQVNLCDIYDGDGRQVSPHKFGAKKNKEAYAITSFGILEFGIYSRSLVTLRRWMKIQRLRTFFNVRLMFCFQNFTPKKP